MGIISALERLSGAVYETSSSELPTFKFQSNKEAVPVALVPAKLQAPPVVISWMAGLTSCQVDAPKHAEEKKGEVPVKVEAKSWPQLLDEARKAGFQVENGQIVIDGKSPLTYNQWKLLTSRANSPGLVMQMHNTLSAMKPDEKASIGIKGDFRPFKLDHLVLEVRYVATLGAALQNDLKGDSPQVRAQAKLKLDNLQRWLILLQQMDQCGNTKNGQQSGILTAVNATSEIYKSQVQGMNASLLGTKAKLQKLEGDKQKFEADKKQELETGLANRYKVLDKHEKESLEKEQDLDKRMDKMFKEMKVNQEKFDNMSLNPKGNQVKFDKYKAAELNDELHQLRLTLIVLVKEKNEQKAATEKTKKLSAEIVEFSKTHKEQARLYLESHSKQKAQFEGIKQSTEEIITGWSSEHAFLEKTVLPWLKDGTVKPEPKKGDDDYTDYLAGELYLMLAYREKEALDKALWEEAKNREFEKKPDPNENADALTKMAANAKLTVKIPVETKIPEHIVNLLKEADALPSAKERWKFIQQFTLLSKRSDEKHLNPDEQLDRVILFTRRLQEAYPYQYLDHTLKIAGNLTVPSFDFNPGKGLPPAKDVPVGFVLLFEGLTQSDSQLNKDPKVIAPLTPTDKKSFLNWWTSQEKNQPVYTKLWDDHVSKLTSLDKYMSYTALKIPPATEKPDPTLWWPQEVKTVQSPYSVSTSRSGYKCFKDSTWGVMQVEVLLSAPKSTFNWQKLKP